MGIFEAIVLGLIQGLTEFLPISSSGHLEITKALLTVNAEESLSFTVAVHGATVLSTLVVFRQEIATLLAGVFKFSWNNETEYVSKLIVSMVPVGLVAFLLKDTVESFFNGNLILVGSMLFVTALLLFMSGVIKWSNPKPIGFVHAFIIGIAQAVAVIPGISRSGATIATGLMIGNRKDELAKFSFLMVIVPIIGANFLEILNANYSNSQGVGALPIVFGFVSAFISGYLACRLMIGIVKKGNLKWFALYCLLAGTVCLFLA